MNKRKLAIFASGAGTNAANLMHYFSGHPFIEIAFVLTNNHKAGVIQKAEDLGYLIQIITNEQAADQDFLSEICEAYKIDYIILAGYLRLIPEQFSLQYANRIINIHPSLLPKFGGKGMYGDHVHQAVLHSDEKQSGISIHFVDAAYDSGQLIAQFSCVIDAGETLESLKQKISLLEQQHYPMVIETYIHHQK
jgi:phosphoribosylglycinamide formyltransferase-1